MKHHYPSGIIGLFQFIALLCFLSLPVSAQKEWTIQYEHSRSFIENKGQFNNPRVPGKVLYAWDDANTVVYFTTKGVYYAFLKTWPKEEKEAKEEEPERFTTAEAWMEKEKEEKEREFKTDLVSMSFVGANPTVEVIPEDICPDYHSYFVTNSSGIRENISFIRSYKKILYKNIYPNIDIEYSFHPKEGIKYTIILHPGADPANLRMQYSSKIRKNRQGDVLIESQFGDIIDHAPASWYSDTPESLIPSAFEVKGAVVTFNLQYTDLSKTVIIDPWTQTPLLPTSHAVMECEHDNAGNVYIIGGESPMQLLKYNSAGVLQWTHNTPYDTANFWLGTFATDNAGNSYITAGSICRLEKVNASNVVQWQWTPGGLTPTDEYWNIAFNCDQTSLIIGGTKGSGLTQLNGAIFDINTTNGNVNAVTIVGSGNALAFPPSIQEVRSITSCRNARYYYLTLDTIGCIDDNLSACPGSSSIFAINHGYHFAYKCENYRPNNGNGGIMSIRANRYYVYTQNGVVIDRRSLLNGTAINTAAIPGGISISSLGQNQVGNSGIDIDTCGNVYVGSGSAMIKYSSNLTQLASYATAFHVFDVTVSTGGNVIACGSTGDMNTPVRNGYVQSFAASACPPMTLYCCDANVCPAGPVCNTAAPFTLTPATPGGVWSGSGITNASTGLFDPSVAGVGNHTVYYTLACGRDSVVVTVNACVTLNICENFDGTITVSGGTAPYNWETATVSQDCSTCLIGCVFPPGCAVNDTVWTSFSTSSTVTLPGTWPVRVTDAGGTIRIIDSTATFPFCSGCPVSLTASPDTICPGQSSTLVASGANSYVWAPSATLSATSGASVTATPLVTTTYTVTGTTGPCTESSTITVTVNNSFSISATASPTVVCPGNSSTLTGLGAASWNWSNGLGTNSTVTVSPASTTTYSVTGSDGTCSAFAAVTVTVAGNPTLSVQAQPDSVCAGSSITLSASGASSYLWSPGNLSGNPVTVIPTANTTYFVTGTSSAGCTGTGSVSVIVSYSVPAGFIVLPNTGCEPLTVTCFYDSLSLPYVYAMHYDFGDYGTDSDTSSAAVCSYTYTRDGEYTISCTIETIYHCMMTLTQTVKVFPSPIADFIAHPDITNTFEPLVSFYDQSSDALTWSWNFGDPASDVNNFSIEKNPEHSYLTAGTYPVILTVTDSMCSDSIMKYVIVHEGFVFYIPNSFTPNADTRNDVFNGFGKGFQEDKYELFIYDRWGEQIFHSTDPETGWNGCVENKDEVCPSGTYVFMFKIVEDNNIEHKYVGTVTLVR
jgi:gliding motility-associated-like protein